MSAREPVCAFGSRNVAIHLARGVGAAICIALAVKLRQTPLPASVAAIAAIVLLRGCPMCWTIGLFETARRRWRIGTSSQGSST